MEGSFACFVPGWSAARTSLAKIAIETEPVVVVGCNQLGRATVLGRRSVGTAVEES
jgi:hypothetical protein